MNDPSRDHAGPDTPRRPYQSPELTMFGLVRELTASGTQNNYESQNGGGGNNGPDRSVMG